MEFSCNFEANNISLCIEFEVGYHIFCKYSSFRGIFFSDEINKYKFRAFEQQQQQKNVFKIIELIYKNKVFNGLSLPNKRNMFYSKMFNESN